MPSAAHRPVFFLQKVLPATQGSLSRNIPSRWHFTVSGVPIKQPKELPQQMLGPKHCPDFPGPQATHWKTFAGRNLKVEQFDETYLSHVVLFEAAVVSFPASGAVGYQTAIGQVIRRQHVRENGQSKLVHSWAPAKLSTAHSRKVPFIRTSSLAAPTCFQCEFPSGLRFPLCLRDYLNFVFQSSTPRQKK